MNRTIIHVVVALLSFFLHNRSRAGSWASEYWIAYRQDGAGDGSLANPYDGATNFDDVMRNVQTTNSIPSVIHILPGTYLTKGFKYTVTNAWEIRNGWRIKGSGIDNTVLQLVDAISDNTNSSGFNTVISSSIYGLPVTNCSVSDLTIDCNYSG